MPPTPTATNQRSGTLPPSTPATPHERPPFKPPPSLEAGEEFAPNAFGRSPAPQFTQYEVQASAPHWYDRVLDLILGEDEMAPKNRIALICKQCRLVNGQAPPGTESLAQLGTWKCMSCGAINGEEKVDEGKKVVEEILKERASAAHSDGEVSASEDTSVIKDTLE